MNTKAFMMVTRQQRSLVLKNLNTLTYQSVRCSGGHGHDEHHHEHHFEQSKRMNTQFQLPTQEELDYQLPKKGIINEKFHQWVAGRWAVDRDDILSNDKPNKYAAYHWFQTQSFLQNKMLLKLLRVAFDNQRSHQKSHHDGFAGGVKTSENGIFLYKSNQADALIRSRVMDYFIVFSGLGWLTGVSQFLLMPFIVACLRMPRVMAHVSFFTFHAELLPHTEQVVFHKADFYGGIRRIIVDIKNLEKIDADIVPSKILWGINMFDQNMVFRDMETKEVFVFDANGIWNEDALTHKLLY